MADNEMDRNEAASPYKLQKARERGQVAKSAEFVSAIVFAAAVIYLSSQGWDSIKRQFRFDQSLLLLSAHVHLDDTVFMSICAQTGRHLVELFAPFFGVLVITAIAANLIQIGGLISFEPIKPDLERINPVNGAKKLFSQQTLFSAFRTILKLLLVTSVVYYTLSSIARHQFIGISELSAAAYIKTMIDDAAELGIKMALVIVLIAILDLLYTHRQFAKKMRMSRRELKDEMKHRDGDPRIRSRIRQLRREMLKRSLAVQNTRNADVLITNPTHIAVALRYQHGEMESPQLIAKGAGALAIVMKKIATRHNIPVVQNRKLARRIYKELDSDHYVPPTMYAEVAKIIIWVLAMRKAKTDVLPSQSIAADSHRTNSSTVGG